MASKLSRQVITVCSSLAFVGGCTQILGISDYEIDPSLGAHAGGEGGNGGTKPSGGTKSDAGGPNGGQRSGEGGAPDTNVGGAPIIGDAGAGGAGAPVGTVVPCDSADCCAQLGGTAFGVEMIKDGGFELGTVEAGKSPWTQLSTNSAEVITNDPSFGFDPKSGAYYAYLSGIPGERSTLYSETVTVPNDAGWLTVSGYRLFQIDLQDPLNHDFCGIGFYAVPPDKALEIPFYWSDPAHNTDGWGDTPNWKRFEASWDAAPHHGAKRRLGLVAESDKYPAKADVAPGDSTASSYLFDDVSLKFYRCYK